MIQGIENDFLNKEKIGQLDSNRLLQINEVDMKHCVGDYVIIIYRSIAFSFLRRKMCHNRKWFHFNRKYERMCTMVTMFCFGSHEISYTHEENHFFLGDCVLAQLLVFDSSTRNNLTLHLIEQSVLRTWYMIIYLIATNNSQQLVVQSNIVKTFFSKIYLFHTV